MSERIDIRDSIISRLSGLLSCPVSAWDGDIQSFNEIRVWPSVQVAYQGMIPTPILEVATTSPALWQRRLFYVVYVNGRTETTPGDEACAEILETIEEDLVTMTVDNGGCFEMTDAETVVKAEAGHFLYAQPWEVTQYCQ